MPESTSFWQRLGSVFRTEYQRIEADADSPGGVTALSAQTRFPRGWWGRRQARAAQLRETSQRLAELMGAMQQHFHRQDERAEQLRQSVERVAATLQSLADAQRGQGDWIRAIADSAAHTSRHTAVLSDTLGRVPGALESQSDAIRGMLRELEASRAADGQLVDSLGRFGSAVEKLNESTASQVQTLTRLSSGEREQKAALIAMVRDQGRRLMVVTIVATLLVVGSLAGVGALLLMRM